jgi:acetaldehyde dehydrogenase (acetylating)
MSMVDIDLLSIQEARTLIRSARAALIRLAELDQGEIDGLVAAIAQAATVRAEELAKMAVEETGFGRWQDKVQKNLLAGEKIYNHIRDLKTIGVLREDRVNKIVEIATPAGVIAALIPSTNPTSTTIYKSLIGLKAGNAVVFSPHPSALKCISATVDIVREVLRERGLPVDLVSVMCYPSVDGTRELMRRADLILATGGPAMIRAAYSSGTPALGVGAGNVPVYIERSADIEAAIDCIMVSKLFDNGTVCASEQAIIVDRLIVEKVKTTLVAAGGYFLNGEALGKVKAIMERPDGTMNPKIVGRTASDIARIAGIDIPAAARLLVCEEEGVGPQYPFSKEKLCALIGFYTVDDWQESCELCFQLLQQGGIGHTLGIHSHNEEVIRRFALKKPVSRLLVNTPTTHGAVGLSTNLTPSLTLGCGTVGGSSTSDNVDTLHLFNIRRVAYGTSNPIFSREAESLPRDAALDIDRLTRLIMEQLKTLT